jgi:AcrR family transcriptional regulator
MKKRIDAAAPLSGIPVAKIVPGQSVKIAPHLNEASAMLGLRERNKLEKAFLIRQAARELFVAKGYEATTLREVATRADVGFGTVFSYAVDKAGLLAMVFVEDLQELPSLFEAPREGPLARQVTATFMKLYAFWARTPTLSREMLPQMEFYRANPFADAIVSRRSQLKAELAQWLRECADRKRLAPKIDADIAAATVFAIYTSALREWIVSEPLDLREGERQLAALLDLPFRAIEKKAR